MVAYVLICAGMLGNSPADRPEYQAAAAKAGRDAGAHLKLALWCEAHGMDAERLKHLAAALASDPQNATARAMMGLVSFGGRWLPPEKVGETVKADEAMAAKLAQYEAKRQATPPTAEAQWQLALWCEKNGMKAEATAHFTAVTQIAPRRTEAWKKLGCELYRGRWIDAEQVAAERADTEAQKKADRHWESILSRWRKDLVFDSPHRQAAVAALSEITDTCAVPSIQRVLGHGNRVQQEMAVQMFSRIECPASSHALGVMSLLDRWPEVRSVAIKELKRRDPQDFMDAMIGLMRRPLKYHVSPVGPSGEPGVLVIENDRARTERVYEVPQIVAKVPGSVGYVATGTNGTTIQIGPPAFMTPMQVFVGMSPDAQLKAIASFDRQAANLVRYAQNRTEQTLEQDLRAVKRFNARVERSNEMIGSALGQLTGESLGAEPDAWLKWWNDKLGLTYERTEPTVKKTTVEFVPVSAPLARGGGHGKCFAAGTQVPTVTGPRPIESLKVGDVVLSQDTVTGVLSYQPIVGLHHNPPAETVRIRLKDDAVVSTPVHRFWRPGRGWAMARDLKPGDFIRTLGGRAEVVEIKPESVQPVFNVDVARNHTFFVGSVRLLSARPQHSPADAQPLRRRAVAGRDRRGARRAGEASRGPSPSLPGGRGCVRGGILSGPGRSFLNPSEIVDPGPADGRPDGRLSAVIAWPMEFAGGSGPSSSQSIPTLRRQEGFAMTAVVLICAGLLGYSPPDRSEYQAAAARAARDAGAHFRLAVWCEAHGMDAERLKHLAAALAIDPQNAAARGMMGLVSYGGRWLPPEKVGEAVKADESMAAKLAEYEAKRQAAPETAEAQWQLGLWCEKNGLKAEATAHFTAVTQIDPYRVEAWRKLGCEWSNGRWIHADQAAADRAEAEAQRKADMHWQPILMQWKSDLGFHGPAHDQAVAALDQITDPRGPVDPPGPRPRQSGPAGDGCPDAQPDRLPRLVPCPRGTLAVRVLARRPGLRDRGAEAPRSAGLHGRVDRLDAPPVRIPHQPGRAGSNRPPWSSTGTRRRFSASTGLTCR